MLSVKVSSAALNVEGGYQCPHDKNDCPAKVYRNNVCASFDFPCSLSFFMVASLLMIDL